MKIGRRGVLFKYYGDELLWIWPWSRIRTAKFFSSVFNMHFTDLRDYWQYVGAWNEGCRREKIMGFNEDEIFLDWARNEFRHSIVVLLRDVNVGLHSTVFWKSVDKFTKIQLSKDVPVLFLNNEKQALKVLHSIPLEFAEAYLFVKGKLVEDNLEPKIEEDRDNNPGS